MQPGRGEVAQRQQQFLLEFLNHTVDSAGVVAVRMARVPAQVAAAFRPGKGKRQRRRPRSMPRRPMSTVVGRSSPAS